MLSNFTPLRLECSNWLLESHNPGLFLGGGVRFECSRSVVDLLNFVGMNFMKMIHHNDVDSLETQKKNEAQSYQKNAARE